MKNWIIGTAGHVDHGKTALVKCLTGVDTDRLVQEKQRGITIENGFAFLDLPGNIRAGIIDVPGHEKFIRTMAAGAWGMDFVMLVIGADEGVMPQTEEHLEILSFLGIRDGVVILTKCDLVSKEICAEREQEIQKQIKGTFLEGREIIRVSSRTGEGISRLKESLAVFCSEKRKSDIGRAAHPFLPVDRVFAVKGTGLVATGTLAGSSLKTGEQLQVYPGEKNVKIRGIQVYGEKTSAAFPGQRTALNVTGEGKDSIKRGMILAPPGSLTPSAFLEVHLSLCKKMKYNVKHGSPVHLHIGTWEVTARVFWEDKKEKTAGESGKARLRLEREIAVPEGMRFVIRFYSPLCTIGGGVVLNPCPDFGNRKKADLPLEKKKEAEKNPLEDIIEQYYHRAVFTLPTTALYWEEHKREKGFSSAFSALLRKGILIRLNDCYCIHKTHYQYAQKKLQVLAEEKGLIETGEFRDILQCSRKTAISLLEYFDKKRITLRTEKGRSLK